MRISRRTTLAELYRCRVVRRISEKVTMKEVEEKVVCVCVCVCVCVVRGVCVCVVRGVCVVCVYL